MTLAALGLALLLQASPTAGTLTGVSPPTLTVSTAPAPVTLLGGGLAGTEVWLRGCEGGPLAARASGGPRPVIRVPAALRRRACVLRVGLAEHEVGLPLPVAEPALFELSMPPPADPVEIPGWSGRFNTLCESDTTEPPAGHSLVAVTGDSPQGARFVLGRQDRALMLVDPVAPAVQDGEPCRYLFLPGVDPGDVRWGPDDVESFWIATLAPDGRTLGPRAYLADMVSEPSGPLDR